MGEKVRGNLVVIGGAEDKEGECIVLRKVVELGGNRDARVVTITTAADDPGVGQTYAAVFRRLGVREVQVVDIQRREEAANEQVVEKIRRATCIFFTGGDQLRITSTLGGSPVDRVMHEAYESGVVIAGTSAGASAMSDTMIVEGLSDESPRKCTLKMAPGMGLLEEVVIDQHFAQRGRIGRLLCAIAQNPYVLGVGIDEDTAVVVTANAEFSVVGSRTVTVVDGREISHTNVSELKPDEPLAVIGVRLHTLAPGYRFDLRNRRAMIP